MPHRLLLPAVLALAPALAMPFAAGARSPDAASSATASVLRGTLLLSQKDTHPFVKRLFRR